MRRRSTCDAMRQLDIKAELRLMANRIEHSPANWRERNIELLRRAEARIDELEAHNHDLGTLLDDLVAYHAETG